MLPIFFLFLATHRFQDQGYIGVRLPKRPKRPRRHHRKHRDKREKIEATPSMYTEDYMSEFFSFFVFFLPKFKLYGLPSFVWVYLMKVNAETTFSAQKIRFLHLIN